MPTIKDVARLAGCSIKTVSRVINNEPHVTEKTRARVLAAIRATGYAPNPAARSLVRQRSFAICILMYPGFFQPASALLSRLLDLAFQENYDLQLQTYYPTFPESRTKLVELVNQRRFDGYIATPPCDADGFVPDLCKTYKVPLVLVSPLERSAAFPWVAGDDCAGSRTMVAHLAALGHRQVAFLRGPRNMRSSADRLSGYRAALSALGLPRIPALERDSEFTFDGGYTAARLLLQPPTGGPSAPRPTAIFAGSDEAAYGALFAAQELGLRVPVDLSIGGYDDLLFSKQIWPGLTTIHQPAEELLERAARLLIDLLAGSPPADLQVTLTPRLEARGSTGPCRQ